MKCREARLELPEHVEGRLSLDKKSAVVVHLQSCGACRVEFEGLQKLYASLKSEQRESVPASYWATLLPRIHERVEERKLRLVPSWLLRYALPLVTAVVVMVILAEFVLPPGSGRKGQPFETPVAMTGMGEGLRDLLQNFDTATLLQVEQANSEALLPRQWASDRDVLEQLLSGSDALYAAIDVDLRSAANLLEDSEVSAIVSDLETKKIIN